MWKYCRSSTLLPKFLVSKITFQMDPNRKINKNLGKKVIIGNIFIEKLGLKLPLALTTHGKRLEANCCNARLMSIHLEGSDGLICTPLFTNLLHSLEHFQGYLTCQNWSLEQFFWHLHGLFDLQSISWGKMGLILGYFDPRRYVWRCSIYAAAFKLLPSDSFAIWTTSVNFISWLRVP